MIDDVRYLLGTFTRRDRLGLVLYVVVGFVVSMMDLLGLAAVLPLMQVLLGADLDSGYIGALHRLFPGDPSRRAFVTWMAVLMVGAFALKSVASLLMTRWSAGLVIRLQIRSSTRLLDALLSESYLRHRQRDTAEALRTIDAAVGDAHGKVLGGLLSLVSSVFSTVVILGLLLVVAPAVTAVAIVYFGLVVFWLQRVLARRNVAAGRDAVMSAWDRSHALINALQGFREVRMHDAKPEFVRRFLEASERNGSAARRALVYSVVPRYVLELMSISGIAIILVLVMLTSDPAGLMPTLTLLVAATIKLMPTMAALTATLGQIRAGTTGLHLAVQALRDVPPGLREQTSGAPSRGLEEARDLLVDDVSFRYPDGADDVLRDITLRVPAGTSLALCGSSGSGKTTLVDVMLGLIEPDRGRVTYGSRTVTELGSTWRGTVAYVPQDVYLLNDSLAANIAFGEAAHLRDEARVRAAVEGARLSEVVAGLPDGLDSMLGERGARLSGGQRQRIGIARALYRRPRVIVFDEATSALDNETENEITQSIRALQGEVTTVIVAHRLSTVRHVDQLAFLESGRVAGLGTFSQVREQSSAFNRMVELGRLDDEVGP
ncbi:ABC transporter ATP-binding protein [Aestuariimicrobium soli]|uniref:ABC transporter ATP-binding protein n=1 Tax=Aestuariimicrobium soli TaxID=2035834 RepID=UPI003EBDA77F